jgi:hypothetical protein
MSWRKLGRVGDETLFSQQVNEWLKMTQEHVFESEPGWVYVVPTCRLIENLQYCKIGFSLDPPERFKSLCTNNPHALDLTNARAVKGSIHQESRLKKITSMYATDANNEWRAFPPHIYQIIKHAISPCHAFHNIVHRGTTKRKISGECLEEPFKKSKKSLYLDLPELAQEYGKFLLPFLKHVSEERSISDSTALDIDELYEQFDKWRNKAVAAILKPKKTDFRLWISEILLLPTNYAATKQFIATKISPYIKNL